MRNLPPTLALAALTAAPSLGAAQSIPGSQIGRPAPPVTAKIIEFGLIRNDPHAAAHTKVFIKATGRCANALSNIIVASR
ncbi:MAG: hypothetical protein NVS9B12_01220 [Vulcanimicrobiaceae bacterium]